MTAGLPIWPVWGVDIAGSVLMIVFSFLAVHHARRNARQDPDNLLFSYMVLLSIGLAAFSVSRGVGHLVKIVLLSTGRDPVWQALSPYSGGLNTVTFVVIFSVTLFYRRAERNFGLLRRYARDVTETLDKLRDAYKAIESNQDRILLLERHAIASRMSDSLAHQTKNPISTIGGYAASLRRRLKKQGRDFSPESMDTGLEVILEETRKLEQLVNSILKTRHEMLIFAQSLDARELVESLRRGLAEKADQAGVGLEVQSEEGEVPIRGDKEGLVMALKEIVQNALEASPPDGTVRLVLDRTPRWAVLSVVDRGPGIDAEEQEKIFEPLYSTKSLASGLGLSFARKLVEMHHGRIELDSSPGRGAVFRVYLPLAVGRERGEEGWEETDAAEPAETEQAPA
jgi:signal transduction histidine kinase